MVVVVVVAVATVVVVSWQVGGTEDGDCDGAMVKGGGGKAR